MDPVPQRTTTREVQSTSEKVVPDHVPFSVVVPYHSNVQAFTAVFINLQAQLVPPKKIIVIDTSPNRQGLDIARRFNTGSCEVVVECSPNSHVQVAWNKGIELAGRDDVLIINDDVLLPMNALDVFALVREAVDAYCFVPVVPPREHSADFVTKGFSWYSEIPTSKNQLTLTPWMPGYAYYLTRELIDEIGVFDEGFVVWFGDSDYETRIHTRAVETGKPAIVQIDTLYVYHFGGKTYKYQSKEIQDLIDLDRQYFAKKYNVALEELVDLAKEEPVEKKAKKSGKSK